MNPDHLTLADAILGEALVFFTAHEKAERGELTLDEIDERIDLLAMIIQSIDVARSNPQDWPSYLTISSSSYEHLWPTECFMLFLLANYGSYHAALRLNIELPLISCESIAKEVFLLEWLPEEATKGKLLTAFLAHPASQKREGS